MNGLNWKFLKNFISVLCQSFKINYALIPGSLLGSQDKGSPIQIFKIEDDHTYSLNVQALAKILLHEKIKDRLISVISIGGAYRKGKSFLLDFMLRYLYSNYVHHNCSNLLGDEDSPLTGFSWRSGSEKETNGIVIWNDVFLVDNKDSKLAVLLMDTQGVFDNQSTVKDCATIFALSLMSSSVFLYNLSNNIQENDLQVLQLFTEYGRLAAEESQESPFQNLTFLLRDWPNPQEHAFGFQGGESFLQKKLMVNPSESQELQSIRKNIKSCFKNINAFLMPHPGFACSEAENFQGQLKDLRKVFVEQLEVLMPSLSSPHKIQPKVINGKSVMAKEWINYFVSYYQFFSSGAVPEPSSLFNVSKMVWEI